MLQRLLQRPLQHLLPLLQRGVLSVVSAEDAVRLRFIQAGLRGERVARNYYAIKTVGTVLVPALIGLVMYYIYRYDDLFIIGTCIFVASATGYYLPDYILKILEDESTL